MLFGWLPREPLAPTAGTLEAMSRALRATSRQRIATWQHAGLAIGAIDLAPLDNERAVSLEPAVAGDRFVLWMVGEAFAWPSHGGVNAAESRTAAFRERLLDAFLTRGAEAVRDLDGEYHVAVWDRRTRRLVLLNDRFGAFPLYWAHTAHGLAFGGGVRGVLLAPGVNAEPDADAIREAVTFGGFRLGTRTNVRGVRMLPGASALTSDGVSVHTTRYWRWSDMSSHPPRPVNDVIDELRGEWTRAITARLAGAGRAGLTLSGGLDSRAIMAEAVRHAPVHAITYGVPHCDDVRIAARAARAVGATWTLHPLYGGENPGWLERRVSHIEATDGLMDLVDLMHVEAADVLESTIDLNLSGFVGDAVTGPTFSAVQTAEQVARAMPYYGGTLGLDWPTAIERATEMVKDVAPAAGRFALFDHKIEQSINRITAALRPHVRVRRPFVDYAVFDLAQGQPAAIRTDLALHERWLRTTYPECCARIPHQKTGVPPLAPAWRRQVTRAARYAWRKGLERLSAAGVAVVPPRRSFHADEVFWRMPAARAHIEGTILRPGSLVCDIFGRAAVTQVVRDWFERLAAPTQVIGALFVYETYHQTSPSFAASPSTSLSAMSDQVTCSSLLP